MEEVKLIGFWVSSFCRRVEIALKLKGIHYQYIEEDLCNKSPLLLHCNPIHKKIPVLLHNGKPISESLVILQYIDETWKSNPILPQDPYDKAIQRFRAKFFDHNLMPALWKTIFSTGGVEEQEKVKEEAIELLKVFENQLKDKKFFGGDAIGFVDIVANFLAFSYRAIQEALKMDIFTEHRFPELWRWAEEYVNCDAIKETLPPKHKLIANFPPPYMGNSVAAIFQFRLAMASSISTPQWSFS